MKNFDLHSFLKKNAIQLLPVYKQDKQAIKDFQEIETILDLKKIPNQKSCTNKIYLSILIRDSRLFDFLTEKEKIKIWTMFQIGKLLAYKI